MSRPTAQVLTDIHKEIAEYFYRVISMARLVQDKALDSLQANEIDLAEYQRLLNASALDSRVLNAITTFLKGNDVMMDASDVAANLREFENQLSTDLKRLSITDMRVDVEEE